VTTTQLETTLPPEELRRSLLKRADDLSMLPAVATEALQLARNPDCTTAQFAGVIERDVKLATEILSICNSVLYSSGKPVANLHQAVIRLGFRQCRNLILTSSAASLMKRLPLEQEWIRELLWRHSFTTAVACLDLNNRLRLGFQGEEFTAGLLQDFGRTLLAVAVGKNQPDVDPLDFV